LTENQQLNANFTGKSPAESLENSQKTPIALFLKI